VSRQLTDEQREQRRAYKRAYNKLPHNRQRATEYMRDYTRRARGIDISTISRPEPANCECCGQAFTAKSRPNCDHDHDTGRFRGWLCYQCNMGIGKLGDAVEGLQKALDYLRGTLN
jgi:Recombination endonuclease VII